MATSREWSHGNSTRTETKTSSENDECERMDQSDVELIQDRAISSDENQSEIYLSIFWSGGKVGIAYYDAETRQIHNMMDSVDNAPDFEIVRQVIRQVEPNVIITSAKQDERLLQMLQNLEIRQYGHEVGKSTRKLALLPSIDFGLDSSKTRIVLLQLPSMPELITDADRAIHLSSIINFQYTAMVRALGGLLQYINKHRIGVQLEETRVRVPIVSIDTFSLNDLVNVDDNTFGALQIFQKEWHPSVYKLGSGGKEGLSLYGILNRCKSAIGRKALKLLMLRPTTKVRTIRERQDAIAFFMQVQNKEVTTTLQSALKFIKDVPSILGRMTCAEASVKVWQSLYKSLYNALLVGDVARAQPQDIEVFRKVTSAYTEDLSRVTLLINKLMDFEESAIQDRFVVKWGVDENLDRKKCTYKNLPDLLSAVAAHEMTHLNNEVDSCSVVYLPQLGYLLQIPVTPLMEATGNFSISGLTFAFTTNKMAYYRSASTMELHVTLGDAQYEITDHETKIMINLQKVILSHAEGFIKLVKYIAELDCLIAMASASRDNNYARPLVRNDHSNILITGGRHPLQELCVSTFVPNDTRSQDGCGKVKVLTGPNASGKSVYLKQVALIVYMAHLGMFVPAEAAEIGVIYKIFSRIHTLESISTGLSTFMIDLNQMSQALQYANEKSLVIVDEFGKGTDNVDGLALLAASLKYWLAKGKHCPHLLVSTHFHSIVSLIPPNQSNLRELTMEVMQSDKELVYLYRLANGRVDSSFALQVAVLAGLPEDVVKRASKVILANHKIQAVNMKSHDKYLKFSKISSEFLKLDLRHDLNAWREEFVNLLNEADRET